MNRKVTSIMAFCLMGASTVTINDAVSGWGKMTTGKELLVSGIGLGMMGISIFLLGRYKMELNPNITNPKLRKLIIHYPVLPGAFAIIIGVAVGVCCMHFLS